MRENRPCAFPGCAYRGSDTREYCRAHRWQLRNGMALAPLREFVSTDEISTAPPENVRLYERRFEIACSRFRSHINRAPISLFVPPEEWGDIQEPAVVACLKVAASYIEDRPGNPCKTCGGTRFRIRPKPNPKWKPNAQCTECKKRYQREARTRDMAESLVTA